MPVEIREVIIKAKLEKPLSPPTNTASLSEEQLETFKQELMEAILEKVEDTTTT